MRARPLFCLGCVAVAAQLVGIAMPSAVCFLLAAFCVFSAILLLVAKQKFLLCNLCVVTVLFLLQGVYKVTVTEPIERIDLQKQQVTVWVESVFDGYSPSVKRVYAKVLQAEETQLEGLKIEAMMPAPVLEGEILKGEMEFFRLQNTVFDQWKRADGIVLKGESNNLAVERVQETVFTKLNDTKQILAGKIKRYLKPELGAIATAVTLGDKSALDSELKECFQKAGLSHLLVVSGLHLSIWCGIWVGVGKLLKKPKVGFLVAVPMSVLFGAFVGFSPSVVRALAGVAAYCMCNLMYRKADGLNSLGLAMLVLVVGNPFSAADISFQLSVSATAGVLFSKIAVDRLKLCRKRKWGKRLNPYQTVWLKFLESVSAAFFAMVATIPVLVGLGNGISLVSVPANLVGGVLLFPLMVFGWLCLGAAFLFSGGFLHRLFAFCVGLTASILLKTAEFFAGLPFSVWEIGGAFPIVVFAVLGIMGIALWHLRSCRAMFAVVPICILICVAVPFWIGKPAVTLVQIGDANPCTVVYFERKAVVFVRGGISNQRNVQEFLNRHRLQTEMLVDARQNADSDLLLYAEKQIHLTEILSEGIGFRALDEKLTAAIYKKQNSFLVLLEIYGLTAAIPYGVDVWEEIPPTTFLLLGSGTPKYLAAHQILTPQNHPWANKDERITSGRQAAVRIWPNREIRLERGLQ